MQPWATAKRFWQVAGPAAIANYPDIETFVSVQHLVLGGLLVATCSTGQIPANKVPFLATCGVRPKPHALDAVPWVQRDPDAAAERTRRRRAARAQLHRRAAADC